MTKKTKSGQNVELWNCGIVELWNCGFVEMWKFGYGNFASVHVLKCCLQLIFLYFLIKLFSTATAIFPAPFKVEAVKVLKLTDPQVSTFYNLVDIIELVQLKTIQFQIFVECQCMFDNLDIFFPPFPMKTIVIVEKNESHNPDT